MSSLQYPYVVELGSQTELLDRVALLSHFRSHFIAICGEQGSGKSWLAQRYLELKAQSQNQCLLLCRSPQTDAEWRGQILEQLAASPLYNPDSSLCDSFSSLFEETRCDAVIVIDNAHLLSDSLLNELWDLVMMASLSSRWRVNVVVFSLPVYLDTMLERFRREQEYQPIELDIEPLSEPEAMALFEKLVVRYMDDSQEKRVRHAFRFVRPLPGDIMALGEKKVEKRIIIRSIVASPLNMILVVALLLFVLVGGYWWLAHQPDPDTIVPPTAVEQTAIPTLSAGTAFGDGSGDNKESPLVELKGEQSEVTLDDSTSLPPPVISETVSVGVADEEHQRVVIDSDVVDALMEGKSESDAATPIVQESDQADGQVNSNVNASVDVNVQNVQKTATPLEQARTELFALSPRSYTLQLAALTSASDADRFVTKHKLNSEARVYATLRQDKTWYIVTYRDYATIQLARDAIATLPASLQALGPWAKSLSQVQRELQNAK